MQYLCQRGQAFGGIYPQPSHGNFPSQSRRTEHQVRLRSSGRMLPSLCQRSLPDHTESAKRDLRRYRRRYRCQKLPAGSCQRFRLLYPHCGEHSPECEIKGEIKGEKSLAKLAEIFGVQGTDKWDTAKQVAQMVLDDLYKPEYEKMELVEKMAYGPRFKRWQELNILPGGAKSEVFHGVVKCSTNLNSDPVDMYTDCLKLGISTGIYGLTLTNLLNDVLLGEPELRMAPVGLRVIDPDYINIMITGHQHTIFVDLQERLTSKEAVAKAQAAGAKGFKLVGCTCVGQDLQLRGAHYTEVFDGHAGNNYTSEAVLATGGIDAVLSEFNCTLPGIEPICDELMIKTERRDH